MPPSLRFLDVLRRSVQADDPEPRVALPEGPPRRVRRWPSSSAPLRIARDIARRIGAAGLEERAHEELGIAGGRPQRVALAGGDSLT